MATSTSANSTTVRSKNTLRLTRAVLQAAYVLSEDLGSSIAERLFTSPRRHVRPARERAVLAAGQPFEVQVALRSPRWRGQATPVNAWRWGIGPTVLLVHGWEGRGSQLGALVEPLVAAGLSVVAFDAPGHGDSPGSRLYLTDLADAVIDVAAAVGPLHAIIAHSFGAAATLLAHQRGGVDVARNVMLAPNVLLDEAFGKFAHTVGLDDDDRGRLEDSITEATGVPVPSLALEALVGTRDAGLLVIHDQDDREVPLPHGERLTAAWPGARLITTTGLGHRRILRDPAVLDAVVAEVAAGLPRPSSDLVREVDKLVAAASKPA